jgi:hypothetical protein
LREGPLKRRVDRERIERADREAKLVIAAERTERDNKTARLREQRLALETNVPNADPKTAPRQKMSSLSSPPTAAGLDNLLNAAGPLEGPKPETPSLEPS